MKSFIFVVAAFFVFPQDHPQEIAKSELPKSAVCVICEARGNGHDEEKPAAGVNYKGKKYFFCNAKELPEFKKNPDFYVPIELPSALPTLELSDTTGKVWNADAFSGKLVLLDYWATWCKPCLALRPKIDKIRTTYKSRGFEVLSISIDEKRDTFERFLKKNSFANPVALDERQSWAKLKIAAIPALFLVKNGQLIAIFRGTADAKAIEAAVKANL